MSSFILELTANQSLSPLRGTARGACECVRVRVPACASVRASMSSFERVDQTEPTYTCDAACENRKKTDYFLILYFWFLSFIVRVKWCGFRIAGWRRHFALRYVAFCVALGCILRCFALNFALRCITFCVALHFALARSCTKQY